MNDETDRETVRWMSYAEFGRLRGVSAATARRMANRRRWKKMPGNDGTMRVAVPVSLAVPRETEGETEPETSRDTSRAIGVLEAALIALRDSHSAEVSALQATHASEVRALRSELTAAEDARNRARAEAQDAQDKLAEVEAAERARKARGRLHRAWAAWRGE